MATRKKQLIFNLTNSPFRVHDVAEAMMTLNKHYFDSYEYRILEESTYFRVIGQTKVNKEGKIEK